MKKFIISTCLLLITAFNLNAQIATDPRTEEYATVRAIISTETGGFSQSTTVPNPYLEIEGAAMELKDFVKDSKGAKFENITEVINYMNKFSWVLVDFTSLDMKASANEAMLLYTFKRKPQKK